MLSIHYVLPFNLVNILSLYYIVSYLNCIEISHIMLKQHAKNNLNIYFHFYILDHYNKMMLNYLKPLENSSLLLYYNIDMLFMNLVRLFVYHLIIIHFSTDILNLSQIKDVPFLQLLPIILNIINLYHIPYVNLIILIYTQLMYFFSFFLFNNIILLYLYSYLLFYLIHVIFLLSILHHLIILIIFQLCIHLDILILISLINNNHTFYYLFLFIFI